MNASLNDLNRGAGPPRWLAGVDEATLRVWVLSLGFWTVASLSIGASMYLSKLLTGGAPSLETDIAVELCDLLPFAPLTPFVFSFATRFPFTGGNWGRRALTHIAGGSLFAFVHAVLRALTPYAKWDSAGDEWVSALTLFGPQGLHVDWKVLESVVLGDLPEDIIFVYAPIVLVAHAVRYHLRVRESEQRKAQLESQLALARLEALKSKLQPHFLFNTLHSISALMLTDVEGADRMLTLLSDLLRMSLSAEGQLTTLREEMEFVNTYLEIEKIRYEDRLQLAVDIAPDTLDAVVPRLVLQPLVENAIRHGIAKRPSGGHVRIAARRDAPHLELSVADNGPGLPAADAPKAPAGLGLKTTRERLRSIYAEAGAMNVGRSREGGVEVRLRFPLAPANWRGIESAGASP
jgi:two-component system, LytTR family, sensor kinase